MTSSMLFWIGIHCQCCVSEEPSLVGITPPKLTGLQNLLNCYPFLDQSKIIFFTFIDRQIKVFKIKPTSPFLYFSDNPQLLLIGFLQICLVLKIKLKTNLILPAEQSYLPVQKIWMVKLEARSAHGLAVSSLENDPIAKIVFFNLHCKCLFKV